MSQQRETATDRLVSIIQLIQLGRRTGLLTAKRGDGITLEEGTIVFTKGQVTQAAVGRRNGSEALNWLTTWGNCRFTFVAADPAESDMPLMPLSSRLPENGGNGTDPRLRQQRPLPNRQSGPLPANGSGRQSGPLPANSTGSIGSNNGASRFTTPIPPAAQPGPPIRTRQLDSALKVIENMGLSRAHRRLLLLIDGQRTAIELVRLMGRDENEVYSLLRDLEQATVIQLPGVPPFRHKPPTLL